MFICFFPHNVFMLICLNYLFISEVWKSFGIGAKHDVHCPYIPHSTSECSRSLTSDKYWVGDVGLSLVHNSHTDWSFPRFSSSECWDGSIYSPRKMYSGNNILKIWPIFGSNRKLCLNPLHFILQICETVVHLFIPFCTLKNKCYFPKIRFAWM